MYNIMRSMDKYTFSTHSIVLLRIDRMYIIMEKTSRYLNNFEANY